MLQEVADWLSAGNADKALDMLLAVGQGSDSLPLVKQQQGEQAALLQELHKRLMQAAQQCS